MGVSQERSSYVNDMRINYAQGSRQAELATVDGAVKRGWEGASLGSTVSLGDDFIILL